MTIIGSAEIAVTPELKNFEKDLRGGVTKSFKGVEDEAVKSGRRIGGGLASGIATGLAAIGATAFLKGSVEEASGLAEQVDGVQRIFGEAADEVVAFGESAAEALGQSSREALTAAANFGALFRAMNFTEEESAAFSLQLTTLASDLASFRDTPIEDALQAIRSGLVGESEPLRRFGVQLSDVRLKAEAVTLGLIQQNGVLDANAKAQAAIAIIMKDTALAQGNFAETADSAANQQRILAAQTDNLRAKIGSDLLPIFQDLLGVAQVLVGAFSALPDPIRQTAIQLGVLAIAIKGLGLAGLASGLVRLGAALPGLITGVSGLATASGAVGLSGALQAAGVSAAGATAAVGALAAATVAAGVAIGGTAIKIIERLREQDSVSAAAADEGENLVRVLRRLGATEGQIDVFATTFNRLRKEGKVTDETLSSLAGNVELLFEAIKNGDDVVAVLEAIFNNDAKALAKLREEYDKARGSTEGLTEATAGLTEEQEKAAAARERLNRAIRDSERAVDSAETRLERAREDGAQRIAQAEKDVKDAIEERNEARADAEKRLAEAREDATKTILDSRKELADFDEESAKRVGDAERELLRIREERTRAIGQASIAVAAAQRAGDAEAENAARIALAEAERTDQEQEALRELSEEKASRAEERIELAQRLAEAEEVAAERVTEAEERVAQVHEDTAERVAEAYQKLADARVTADRAVADAEDALTAALDRQVDSVGDAKKAHDAFLDTIEKERTAVQKLTKDVKELRDVLLDPIFVDPGTDPITGVPTNPQPADPFDTDPFGTGGATRRTAAATTAPTINMNISQTDPEVLTNILMWRLVQGVV